MRTISVHVSESDYAEFKSLAAQGERPVAELIRDAMACWLTDHRRTGASLRDVRGLDCGSPRLPFDRADLADEMFGR